MVKKLLTLLIVILSNVQFCYSQSATSYGPDFNGYKLAKDSSQVYYVVNKNDVAIGTIDELTIDTDSIIAQIKKSTIPDRFLISSILAMHGNPKGRTNELLHTTRNYNEIALLVLTNVEFKLGKIYSEKQLEKIRNKKK